MYKLFEATTINGMVLSNRFVRSATWEALAGEDGSCTSRLADMMVRLAAGGVGLIITGHAYVSRHGQAGPRQLGIYSDTLLPGLSRMTEAVHREGGKIALQLAHAGCHAVPELTGQKPFGPSVMEGSKGELCRAITREEIEEVVEAFAMGAARAKRAGFDAVQIHAAHGYLLSQFLSPYYNKRSDEYGGSVENRARVILDVLRSIRHAVGGRFPVVIKINSQDFLDNGFSTEEMIEVAGMLEAAGIDAIEMSGGTIYSGKFSPIRKGRIDTEHEEVYYREEAVRYKEKIKVPLMLVGGIRSYAVAEQLVEDGVADYISLSRPLIRKPDLISTWKSGDTDRSSCLCDNRCFKPALRGEGIRCISTDCQEVHSPRQNR